MSEDLEDVSLVKPGLLASLCRFGDDDDRLSGNLKRGLLAAGSIVGSWGSGRLYRPVSESASGAESLATERCDNERIHVEGSASYYKRG